MRRRISKLLQFILDDPDGRDQLSKVYHNDAKFPMTITVKGRKIVVHNSQSIKNKDNNNNE